MQPETNFRSQSEAAGLARQSKAGQREVAAILGGAAGTWKSQLHRARLRVRQLLRKYLGDKTHNDQLHSDSKKTPALDGPARKADNSIPSWCRPIDDKTPDSKK
jgi:hypothetical protein